MQLFVFTSSVCNAAPLALGEAFSDTDQLRYQSIKSEKRRAEFLSGRLLARQGLLAVYGEQALSWMLDVQSSGAPALLGEGRPPAISLSHSRGCIVFAAADVDRLGVDVELVQPRKHLNALAGEVLHSHELAEFSQLDGESQARFFYSKWVMKEAFGKALGCGINYPMHEVLLKGEQLMAAPRSCISSTGDWQFSHKLLDGGYSLGLAWHGDSAHSVSIESLEIHL